MIQMELWYGYTALLSRPDFGKSRAYVGILERNTVSLGGVVKRAINLEIDAPASAFFDDLGYRYIIANNITFDMLISLYDVNSTKTFACRAFGNSVGAQASVAIKKFIAGLKKPNLELRCIGFQDESLGASNMVSELHQMTKASLTEVDLFGNQMRHICIDMKTGLTYDLLLENRRYRAGELINKTTRQEFNQKYGIAEPAEKPGAAKTPSAQEVHAEPPSQGKAP